MLARPHKGVFWLIDGEIWAVPFDEQKYKYGISKSGDSYVHRKIWEEIRPRKCRYHIIIILVGGLKLPQKSVYSIYEFQYR